MKRYVQDISAPSQSSQREKNIMFQGYIIFYILNSIFFSLVCITKISMLYINEDIQIITYSIIVHLPESRN